MKQLAAVFSVLLPACAAFAAGKPGPGQAPPPLPKGLAPAALINLDSGEAFKVEVELPKLKERDIRGNVDVLTVELFFDTFEAKKSVHTLTDPIEKLTQPDPEKHRPPLVMFTWGSGKFQGEVESARVRDTLFLPDGTPTRAVVVLNIKEAGTATEQLEKKPRN